MKYFITTYDYEREEYTPQKGVRTGPYSLFGLRKALRKLEALGYETSRSANDVHVRRVGKQRKQKTPMMFT